MQTKNITDLEECVKRITLGLLFFKKKNSLFKRIPSTFTWRFLPAALVFYTVMFTMQIKV